MDLLERIKLLGDKLDFNMDDVEYCNDILNGTEVDDLTKDCTIEVFDSIENGDELHLLVDSHIDLYTADLLEWAKSNMEWVDEARDEGMCDENASIVSQIQAGQYSYYSSQIHQEIGSLKGALEDIEEEDYLLESKITAIVA